VKTPKRIAIFGLPGSGKSTFADKLAKILRITVHHLDKHYFVAGWQIRQREEFLQTLDTLVSESEWIIEGNSIATLETRFAKADVVIYFAFSRFLCLWRVLKRPFSHDKTILDIPEGCSKGISWSLLKYLWTFKKEKREKIEELKAKYPYVDFHTFHSPKCVEEYMQGLTCQKVVR
jgi:adenylate kinase family enzyme